MRNRPPYALQSVDHALLLIQLLRDTGGIRVSDAAQELGTARSTAHRLLAMLVYRDFAVQDEDHNYVPGPALSAASPADGRIRTLRRTLEPYLETLSDTVGESVNLSIRVGTECRFIGSVECSRTLRVADRRGTILPAALTSGGRALLATLPWPAVTELYGATGEHAHTDMSALRRHLNLARRRGYAVNDQETEDGVSAMGACLLDADGNAVAAMSIAVPTVRFGRDRLPVLAEALRETVDRANAQLSELGQ